MWNRKFQFMTMGIRISNATDKCTECCHNEKDFSQSAK